jgi:predicted nucleic acid-binding protein
MGSLALPASGSVYVDTSIIIYSVETHAVYWPSLKSLWEEAKSNRIVVVSSELAILETLVGPLARNDAALIAAYERLFLASELRLLPITRPTLLEGARLRVRLPSLRTPDALHAATAILAGCAMFLTNDEGFRRVGGLPCTVLRDIIGS